MANVTPNAKTIFDPTPLSVAMPSSGGESAIIEDESFPTVEETFPQSFFQVQLL